MLVLESEELWTAL